MIADFKKLMLRAVPELAGLHVTRIGEVVGIPDAPAQEEVTDRYRPRYAVDVQMLLPNGDPDSDWPVLEALPLPAFGTGDGRGLFAFPDVGTRVRVAFDYGLATHPYIAAVLSEGRAVPALAPGDMLLQQGDGCALLEDAEGNVTLQTDRTLRLDAHRLEIAADEAEETLGELTRTVAGRQVESIGDLDQTVLGAQLLKIGADRKTAILGADDLTVGGDQAVLVAGKSETAVAQDINVKSVLGDILLQAVVGSATLQSAIKASITSALVDLGVSPTDALVLGTAFLALFNAHTHNETGGVTLPPNQPMVAGTHTSVTVKTV